MRLNVNSITKIIKSNLKNKVKITKSTLILFLMLGITDLSIAAGNTDKWAITENEKKYKQNQINNLGNQGDNPIGISVNTAGRQYAFKKDSNGIVTIIVTKNKVAFDNKKFFKIGEDIRGDYYKVKTLDAFLKLKEIENRYQNDGEYKLTQQESNEIIRLNNLSKNTYGDIISPTAIGLNSVAIGNGAQSRGDSVISIGNKAGLTDKLNKYSYKYNNTYYQDLAQ